MPLPDISGAWLSKLGNLIYIITQIEDRFIRRVIHDNGVMETGIGSFLVATPEGARTDVDAKWNFNGEDVAFSEKSEK